jgi:dTDP-4-dehydrorhamnose 3,5-epimerase-like enzyme
MDNVTWETLRVMKDSRGSVFEPLDGQLLCEQRNLHVVVNRPGAVRGNHFHRQAVEFISVGGPARVCYQKGDEIESVLVDPGVVMRFRFPPGVAHAIQNIGTEDQVLVALTDRFHNPQAPDTIHKPLINTKLGETP